MDHPSKEWKDVKTEDLLKEKQNNKILDHHIRFKGLIQGDERDHQMCFLWEYNRTRVFMKEKLDFADSNIVYLTNEIVTFGAKMAHDDTIEALYYACLNSFPPDFKQQKNQDGKREWYKPRRKAKSWIVN